MKFLPLIIVLFLSPIYLIAQSNSTKEVSSKNQITPKTISIFGIDFNDDYSTVIFKEFKDSYISNATNEILLEDNSAVANITHQKFSKLSNREIENNLQQLLNSKNIGQQILSYWFNRQENGKFNTSILVQNGFTDLTEQELIHKSKSRKGREKLLKDGLDLINKSYILVFEFNEIKTLKQFYGETNTKENNQILNGFTSTVNCYLVHLDFKGKVLPYFFQNLWTVDNTDVLENKKAAFYISEFPFRLKSKLSFKISSTQHNQGQPLANSVQKSSDELLKRLVQLSIEKALSELKNTNTNIKFKYRINNTDPVSADVGKAGWMKFDQSYFVYENKILNNGKIKEVQTGVIKSNFVTDSTSNNSNKTFYQIAGNPIENGMYIKKKNDIGLNIVMGNSFSGLPGIYGRVEYYLSKLFGDVIFSGSSAKGAASFKIYFEKAGNNKAYTIEEQINNYHFRRGSFGVSKDFYPSRHFHISPFLGYGLESVKWKSSPNKVSSNFAEFGANVGINITHNVQLIATYNHFQFFKSILLDEQREVIDENYKYDLYFSDRNKKSGFSIGLRFML